MKRYIQLERNQAGIIQSKYCCAWCWGELRVCHDENGDYITDGNDECRGSGFVTKGFVKHQIEKKYFDFIVAKEVLQDYFPKEVREKRPVGKMMEELGF